MPETKIVVAKPKARLWLIHTQPPLDGEGVTVERFTTRHGATFERHSTAAGHIQWFKVENKREQK